MERRGGGRVVEIFTHPLETMAGALDVLLLAPLSTSHVLPSCTFLLHKVPHIIFLWYSVIPVFQSLSMDVKLRRIYSTDA